MIIKQQQQQLEYQERLIQQAINPQGEQNNENALPVLPSFVDSFTANETPFQQNDSKSMYF